MFIVAAKHYAAGKIVQQPDQCVEVAGGAALPDDDLHALLQFVQRFFAGEAFVVGADDNAVSRPAGVDIPRRLFAAQSRRMAANGC